VTPTPKRLALAAEVARYRKMGLTHREIAKLLGISRSYTSDLDVDPLGEKGAARKKRYGRPCPDCGDPMTGCNGPAGPHPERCERCERIRIHEDRYWTQERIVEALREFRRLIGKPPTSTDALHRGNNVISIEERVSPERVKELRRAAGLVRLPCMSAIYREFGSWDAAMRAAGLDPVGPGTPPGVPRRLRRNVGSPA
jgi:hypothetical protein